LVFLCAILAVWFDFEGCIFGDHQGPFSVRLSEEVLGIIDAIGRTNAEPQVATSL